MDFRRLGGRLFRRASSGIMGHAKVERYFYAGVAGLVV